MACVRLPPPCQFPSCAHICVTYKNAPSAGKFVEDLNASVADALADPGACWLASSVLVSARELADGGCPAEPTAPVFTPH
jgi:hypothetical protein